MTDFKDLAGIVKTTRGRISIRVAAKAIGISPTTLCKIERGHIPDIKTLTRVCDWLEEQPAQFTTLGNRAMNNFESKFNIGEVARYVSANDSCLVNIVGVIFTVGRVEYHIEWMSNEHLNRFTVIESFLNKA